MKRREAANIRARRLEEPSQQTRRRWGTLSLIKQEESDANIFTSKHSKAAKGSSRVVPESESSASQCPGRNGLCHVNDRWMWDDADEQLHGRVVRPADEYAETKISPDLLRKRSQSRSQKPAEKTSRDRARGVICRSVERSPQGMGGGENAGAGPGCQRPGGSVYGALDQCDVSRMWDESGLDNARRTSSRGMAASLGTDAQTTGRRGPGGVDRAGDGRSWVICGLGVSGDPSQ